MYYRPLSLNIESFGTAVGFSDPAEIHFVQKQWRAERCGGIDEQEMLEMAKQISPQMEVRVRALTCGVVADAARGSAVSRVSRDLGARQREHRPGHSAPRQAAHALVAGLHAHGRPHSRDLPRACSCARTGHGAALRGAGRVRALAVLCRQRHERHCATWMPPLTNT